MDEQKKETFGDMTVKELKEVCDNHGGDCDNCWLKNVCNCLSQQPMFFDTDSVLE